MSGKPSGFTLTEADLPFVQEINDWLWSKSTKMLVDEADTTDDEAVRKSIWLNLIKDLDAVNVAERLLMIAKSALDDGDDIKPTLQLGDWADEAFELREDPRIPKAWYIDRLLSTPDLKQVLHMVAKYLQTWFLEQYPHVKTYEHMEKIIKQMNKKRTDPTNWTVFNPTLGGLVCLRINVSPADAHRTWGLRPEVQGKPPHWHLGCHMLGLWIIPAPFNAMIAYLDMWTKNTCQACKVDFSGDECPALPQKTDMPRVCNACNTAGSRLHCSCTLARYCSKACQKTDWRRLHKALCKWQQQVVAGEYIIGKSTSSSSSSSSSASSCGVAVYLSDCDLD